jgi:hypothetical protein
MALMRFRQGGFIRLPTDEPDEPNILSRVGATGFINEKDITQVDRYLGNKRIVGISGDGKNI